MFFLKINHEQQIKVFYKAYLKLFSMNKQNQSVFVFHTPTFKKYIPKQNTPKFFVDFFYEMYFLISSLMSGNSIRSGVKTPDIVL